MLPATSALLEAVRPGRGGKAALDKRALERFRARYVEALNGLDPMPAVREVFSAMEFLATKYDDALIAEIVRFINPIIAPYLPKLRDLTNDAVTRRREIALGRVQGLSLGAPRLSTRLARRITFIMPKFYRA